LKVPLLDLKAQHESIRQEIRQAIEEVLESQHFILGPQVEACEQAIAQYAGCSFGVGVSSGTDALLICLMAEGIGAGDEVITTPYTFFATAGSIARVGARPVFVDIEPVGYNLDPGQIEARVTPRTRAIIPVHLFGQMADMEAVMQIAQKRNLIVIEDAAQALGAERGGRRAGAVGHYGCFSFFPSKNLGAAGDGGMVVTSDARRAELLTRLRAHGSKPKYYHKLIGGNFRLDALQAAIVLAKLAHLDDWTAARQRNARRYDALFASSGLQVKSSAEFGNARDAATTDALFLPARVAERHVFNQYILRTSRRDELKAAMQQMGVGTEIYYPVPMHLQECFAALGYCPGAFPESERAAKETLALPIYPELTDEQARYVVECAGRFFQAAAAPGASDAAGLANRLAARGLSR
jgi:dTDP-4-amino-4,6-dideoxygalactose transaminase